MADTLPSIKAAENAYMKAKLGTDRIAQAKRDLAPHVERSRYVLSEYKRLRALYYDDLVKLSSLNLRALFNQGIPPSLFQRLDNTVQQTIRLIDSGLREMAAFPLNVSRMTLEQLGQGGREQMHPLSPKLVPNYDAGLKDIPARITTIRYCLREISTRLNDDKRKSLVPVTIFREEDFGPDPNAVRTSGAFDVDPFA